MTQEEVKEIMSEAQVGMEHSLEHLEHELIKVRTGKASPTMVNELLVNYYGSPTPLNQVGNITSADSRTLMIQPWEKSVIPAIEKAIFEANLGVTPQNDGEVVRITIPMLTEERRKELVKQAKHLGEEAKVSIRNSRRHVMDELKKAIKAGLPEDIGKRKEDELQKMTNSFTDKVDKMIDVKEKDIMTV